MSERIELARLHSVAATDRTEWLFVELALEDGRTGWGEASLQGLREPVETAGKEALPELIGRRLNNPDPMTAELAFGTLPQAAVSSAISQALWDLDAQRSGACLADRLGGRRRDRIGLYANINRRTRDRSPAGAAASARDACAAGYTAVKIAPFDEVRPDLSPSDMRAAMERGLERAAAIREAVGTGTRLMLDCHWRFDADGARELIEASCDLGLYWIECPVPETPETIPVIRQLRHLANASGTRLAGLELQVLEHGFRPFLEAGAYDVMMPDVKYVGGPAEMLRVAALLARHGVEVSPHNPTGPICHAHSLHVCAALAGGGLLEHQFDESAAFGAIVGDAIPPSRGGSATLDWTRPGLGVALRVPFDIPTEVALSAGGLHS